MGFPAVSLLPSFYEETAAPGDLHLHPSYRAKRGIEAMLRKVPAGFDQFLTEKDQDRLEALFREWSVQLLRSPQSIEALEKAIPSNFSSNSPKASQWNPVREENALQVWQGVFPSEATLGRDAFLRDWRSLLGAYTKILTAEFQVTSIRSWRPSVAAPAESRVLETVVRFELVGAGAGFFREQRIGQWNISSELQPSGALRLLKWTTQNEARSRAAAPVFLDVAERAFGANRSFAAQFQYGTDHWRTVLDGASGIDIYGHNGVSVADVDGDGFDDLYICQPAGLPNRLYRNRGDGTFEDITELSGVGVLENSACALFADLQNSGHQDLIVVRANGPLLFLNQGGGKFRAKPGAFQFANPPQGTFTGAAIADYDRDGWLDIYFCLYAFYQGTGQYRYPMPYHDAENGPPNFLMRNNRDGSFTDVTRQSGLDKNNTRFSFCCAWGDHNGDQWPDLYVVNDFGRKNLYRNNGDGTFTDVAHEAGVEDVGAGMSACWRDFDNDGREDLYVADMWTAAGLRISEQDNFQKGLPDETRALYRKHAMGNTLLHNGANQFSDDSLHSGTSMGRWAWSSDSWDFDHDGFADLYIANGMITGASREDLNSFFWRQVVANSPKEAKPSHEYEQGWSAVNELIRSDATWSGFERNVFYLNNRNGTFSDVSAVVGLDCIEDSRSFALGDFDLDGRLEIVLKNRNAPQLRLFRNVMPALGPAISFRLSGNKSNRDAIGASVTIETEAGRQTRHRQAGSGFLAQHTRELHFGLGAAKGPVQATIRWPSGLTQKISDLPQNHRVWVQEGEPPSRTEPFSPAPPPPFDTRSLTSPTQALPAIVETWLLSPVQAPDFSLPDQHGHSQTLSAHRGKPALLTLWSPALGNSEEYLQQFESAYSRWLAGGVQLLVANVDGLLEEPLRNIESLRNRPFPILQATPDFLAVYNLLFRQLFDRHRDLSLPASFLIDKDSAIVKIYQGSISAGQFDQDFQKIPRTDPERIAKALPFPGFAASYEFGRNNLSLGSQFFERGYPQQAELFFRLVLKDEPTSAEALYGIGSVYLQQEKNKEARESFERAIQLRASYPGTLPNAWNNLGILSAREGNTAAAIESFERALQIDPLHSIALLNLGNAYRQNKDWPRAEQTLRNSLALNPDEPEANFSLAMVFAQLNDSDQAFEYLKKALALRPDYPEALNNLGVLYLRTHRPQDAIQAFQESIRVGPAYDQSYLNLARVYDILGDHEKARAVLLDLLRQRPNHPQATAQLKQLTRP